MNTNEPKLAASEIETVIAAARAAYSQLRTLQAGGIAGDRKPLEAGLDRSIIAISKLIPDAKGEDFKNLNRALRDIRDYRWLFPRTDASDPAAAQQAQRILEEFSKG
jgi:hypothetical protein